MRCKVCSTEFSAARSFKCPYCGFDNGILTADKLMEMQKSYREELLSKLSGFSVRAYTCQWDEKKNAFGVSSGPALFDPSKTGLDYYDRIVPSNRELARIGAGRKHRITVDYLSGTVRKSVEVDLIPKGYDAPWYLGLSISKDLRLYVYLGTRSFDSAAGTVRSEAIELDLP